MHHLMAILLLPIVALGLTAGALISAVVSLRVEEIGVMLLAAVPAHLVFWLIVRFVRHRADSTTILGISTTAWKVLIVMAYASGLLCGIAILWDGA